MTEGAEEPEPPNPALLPVGTEDYNHGGLEAVLAYELDRHGLPPHAGLTGLLRHMELSRGFSEGLQQQTIEMLRAQIARVTEDMETLKKEEPE